MPSRTRSPLLWISLLLFVSFVSISFYIRPHKIVKRPIIVINTWNFTNANEEAWKILQKGGSALDAIEVGCSICEQEQGEGTVGYGGSPDENGETTLDSMIMDGRDMNVGAVGALRNIKNAISVARHVLHYTKHSLLVGDQATQFAIQMGFKKVSLSTNHSKSLWKNWKTNNCQPNFWTNVIPKSDVACGPYTPAALVETEINKKYSTNYGTHNHDTIGMLAIDIDGNIAAGTSTNGAIHKIPGRVGDSPIVGAGAYTDGYSAAAATGDGDILMRFLPSFNVVSLVKNGISPKDAATKSLMNIVKYYDNFQGAVIGLTKSGEHGAACHGWKTFPYIVSSGNRTNVIVINCIGA